VQRDHVVHFREPKTTLSVSTLKVERADLARKPAVRVKDFLDLLAAERWIPLMRAMAPHEETSLQDPVVYLVFWR
jgi:hypothetical protein